MGSRRAMKFVLPANRAQKAHPTPHRRSSRVVRQVASESAETKWCPGAAPQFWPSILMCLAFRYAQTIQYQQMYQHVSLRRVTVDRTWANVSGVGRTVHDKV